MHANGNDTQSTAHPVAGWRGRTSLKVTGASRVIGTLLGCLLIAAVFVNCANVVSRYVFARAILGAEEIQVFILVWITFVGIAGVGWRGEHLRMDVLVQRIPPRLRTVIDRTEASLVALLALFMLYQSWHFTALMINFGRNSDALGIPMAVPHIGLVTGFLFLSVISLLRLAGLGGERKEDTRL
jgi:TRAP-type C4-dicarboxylate transport system permease small subunit